MSRSPVCQIRHAEKTVVRVRQTFLSACFAPLRMTCVAITFGERFPSCPRQTCHPEEAALPGSGSSAGWLTKDLLRHRLMPERVLSLAVTRQAARLRLHSQADAARVLKGFRVTGISTSSMTASRQATSTGSTQAMTTYRNVLLNSVDRIEDSRQHPVRFPVPLPEHAVP